MSSGAARWSTADIAILAAICGVTVLAGVLFRHSEIGVFAFVVEIATWLRGGPMPEVVTWPAWGYAWVVALLPSFGWIIASTGIPGRLGARGVRREDANGNSRSGHAHRSPLRVCASLARSSGDALPFGTGGLFGAARTPVFGKGLGQRQLPVGAGGRDFAWTCAEFPDRECSAAHVPWNSPLCVEPFRQSSDSESQADVDFYRDCFRDADSVGPVLS